MAVHSRHDHGHLVFYDSHLKRVVDVVGPDVTKYKLTPNELNPSTTDPSGWTATVVEAGTGTSEFNPSDAIDFIGDLITAANENDGINVQLLGEQFKLDADHHIYFGIKFKINDVIQSDFLAGLCITDTAMLGGVSDGVYFESLDASASVSFVSEAGSTETQTDSVGTLVVDTVQYWEFYWDGTKLQAFVDGVSVYYATPANLPAEELRVSLHFLSGEAIAQTLRIQDLRAFQWGRA